MLSFILFADDTNYFLSHRNIETLFRDLSFIRGGESWCKWGEGHYILCNQKGEGHQKFKQGFVEGHISFRKHCCSLKIKINKQMSPLHSKHF